ncbi:hypothetical protein K1T71_010143 [Dendrolimus kikuchii]|uniref:Uncharacterized protein n=1 Tax=Dendrolimus kikuchii TaxID=765133 RepID=A0ACC1CRX4_9NEOP|nr:hypothetical protein K1T71_010143 [Dendrolimus kikuchii]
METTLKHATKDSDNSSDEGSSVKNKQRIRVKKRKRVLSDSSSTGEDILPDNMLMLENKVHASAVKNNLDDISVRKILKKVVTNDRVLALVKLREEKEGTTNNKDDPTVRPKLTRAKVRELMKASPKSAWNLENLELTPIKHIPVKTRPEVKALIAQELPEDEDDEEYKPTPDDVPSDDDHVLESCSDVDSQPRTPATPKSQRGTSPKVVTDGPFKVPQAITASAKRKLELEEDATIALRTRSKLSLSSTSIEHIESTFVPPDDIPNPVVDEVWSQFLEGCLNPASTSKNEDDDETDPEYNVAADPDANEEDEEALGNSIIKISKKELNDLVTELFHIMPDATVSEDLAENLANTVLTDNTQSDMSHWEGKQEPLSDDEERMNMSNRIMFEKSPYTRLSIGKTEPDDLEEQSEIIPSINEQPQLLIEIKREEDKSKTETDAVKKKRGDKNESSDVAGTHKVMNKKLKITIVEREETTPILNGADQAPLSLRVLTTPQQTSHNLEIQLQPGQAMTPDQILILQQQLRQHIQLATSNFLQLYVHPQYWSYAPAYKKYLDTFTDLLKHNPKTVVNVCNLKPAMELMTTWQDTVSEDTPENTKLVQFIQKEIEKNRRNAAQNHLYAGDFPEMFKEVVVNSPVFLYPHLLPPIPYRADNPMRRNTYLQSEDSLIALGLDQFCDYVEANPEIFKTRFGHRRHRMMLSQTVVLVAKHMLPWMSVRCLHSHISHVRKTAPKSNPLYKFIKNREIVPVKHNLLPFNPALTLYEQPEAEMPRVWLKHLSKYTKRFNKYLKKNNRVVKEPEGIPVATNHTNSLRKEPLPDFTKEIKRSKNSLESIDDDDNLPPRVDIHIVRHEINNTAPIIYKPIELNTSVAVTPLNLMETSQTNLVTCVTAPITTPAEINMQKEAPTVESFRNITNVLNSDHCTCCLVLRRICKRQTSILEYFKRDKRKKCFCSDIEHPKMTNRLKLLIGNYKHNQDLTDLDEQLTVLHKLKKKHDSIVPEVSDLEELAFVLSFQARVINRTTTNKNVYIKMRVNRLFSSYTAQKDVVQLAAEFGDICGTDLVDVYMDFIGFLTAEQADSMGMFKYHFTTYCVGKLIARVKEEVKCEDHLKNILAKIRQVYSDTKSTACEICTRLLETVKVYPRLAEYVFKLFPHRKEKRKKPNNGENATDVQAQPPVEENFDKNVADTKEMEESSNITPLIVDYKTENSSRSPEPVVQTAPEGESLEKTQTEAKPTEESLVSRTLDYEADDSFSDEECPNNVKLIVSTGTQEKHLTINPLTISNNDKNENAGNTDSEEIDQKPETQDYDTEYSMVIVCEEEDVKHEPAEWKRDEDKLILEVLNQFLAPKERKDKTILEVISENNIFELLSETLLHKSKEDVKDRVLYLLNILINEGLDCK